MMNELTYFEVHENWDAIINMHKDKQITNYINLNYLNMALAKKGQLANHLFNYDQRGPAGLLMPWDRSYYTSALLSDIHFMITRYQGLNVYDREYTGLIDRLNGYNKRMVIAGQMNLIYLFEKKYSKLLYKHFVWLTEHIGNKIVPGIPIKNFDAALYALPEETLEKMAPELVITYGGHGFHHNTY